MDDGVKINLVSMEKLNGYSASDKIDYIIGEVRDGTVLVLERGLRPDEEIRLIEKTMSVIDHNTFIGLEIESYVDSGKQSLLDRILRRTKRTSRMTVIGPATHLKTIYKDNHVIEAMILTKKAIIDTIGDM